MNFCCPRSRQTEIVTQEFEDEIVIYDLKNNKALVLNETCAFVWRNCDGKTEVSKISRELAENKKQPINEEIIWLAVEQLGKYNLIENVEVLKNKFEGLNRRQIVKKIGLSTLIALPVITTMIAPTAVSAQSGMACITAPNPCIFNSSTRYTQSNCCAGLRCDELTATTGFCSPCFMTGNSFGGTGASIPACDALVTKSLCCNPTGTPIIGGGFCGCP